MSKTIRLAILAATLFSLPGCIAWRSGPYDYDFRVPVGDGTYKCCRTERVKVADMRPASSLKIKERGLPMSKVKFSSGKELSEALGNREKLNATPEEFIEAINKYHNVGLNKNLLQDYLESLEAVDCPEKEKYVLSSVVINDKRRLGQIEREFKPGEKCFKDRNTQVVIGSADCGNIGKPASLKDFALAEYKEIKVCETCEGPPQILFRRHRVVGLSGRVLRRRLHFVVLRACRRRRRSDGYCASPHARPCSGGAIKDWRRSGAGIQKQIEVLREKGFSRPFLSPLEKFRGFKSGA